MAARLHSFHIPVMGTGFSLDTPLRVGRFGIASVMSLVDDALIERVRRHYTAGANLPFTAIGNLEPDARARRITAWLDLVHDLLDRQMDAIRALPFASEKGNDKAKYFELLPDESPLRRAYDVFLAMPPGRERERTADELTRAMVSGSADVNIMTKLDRPRTGPDGAALAPDQSDAKAALRGLAASRLRSCLVLSAGMNPTLFGTLERFSAFYRDDEGHVAKGIILKVSDFRSALIQAKFLAKKGLEVQELRIESGLNCGGHLFATDGELLGPILGEFQERLGELQEVCEPAIRNYYEKHGKPFVGEARRPRVTVQGGIGTAGEVRRLREHYGADATGWATPFLLVREATALDDATRAQLAAAIPDDLYVSEASPLGIPFNNLRGSSSELWMKRQIEQGHPGSLCPRGYLASNTDLTQAPVCTASREYQEAKLHALGFATPPPAGTDGAGREGRLREGVHLQPPGQRRADGAGHHGRGAAGRRVPGAEHRVVPLRVHAAGDGRPRLRARREPGAGVAPSLPRQGARDGRRPLPRAGGDDEPGRRKGARSPREDRREPAARSVPLPAAGPDARVRGREPRVARAGGGGAGAQDRGSVARGARGRRTRERSGSPGRIRVLSAALAISTRSVLERDGSVRLTSSPCAPARTAPSPSSSA